MHIDLLEAGLPGPKKLKRPNLAISCLKKANFSNVKKAKKAKFSKKIYQNISNKFWNIIKCCMFCKNLTKIGQKRNFFHQYLKRPKKWPNIFFRQIRLIWPFLIFEARRQT